MKIGLVGYQGSGKSTLFEWLTGVTPDPALHHTAQSAMAAVPDERIEPLCGIYKPKKITMASIELVDTPGLTRSHEGNAARLALIREAGALVLVVAAFGGADPLVDLATFREDLLLADLEIVTGRVERLRESLKKPKVGRENEQAELAALEPMLAALEASKPLAMSEMNEEQLKATRSFRLLTEKPTMVLVNTADDESKPERFTSQPARADSTPAVPISAASVGLQVELARMSAEDRAEFLKEMHVAGIDRDALLRAVMDASGQFLYFTAGEKEVRTWMLFKGGTALDAAANVHTDLARGFIRAEVMACADLIRLGSEREIKAHNLLRQEPKHYIVKDGDVLFIKSGV